MSNAPARNPDPKTPPAATPVAVWVINRENCIRMVTYYGKPVGEASDEIAVKTKAVHKARCYPGLNLLDPEVAKACGIGGPRDLDPCHTSGGRLVAKRPTDMDDGAAIDVAMITASKRALRAWLEVEDRAEVRKAIEERLANVRTGSAGEKD